MNKNKFNIPISLVILLLGIVAFSACKEDEEMFERTRLFRPVLNEALYSEANTIIVNMGNLKEAVSYTLEVSRDTFKTVEYVIETDTSYVEIDEELVGEELFWNALYQVRATAHADMDEYDSKVSDLGNVRTQRFPTILNIPESYDVIDVAARVSWTSAGAPVTSIQLYGPEDLRLQNPLLDEPRPITEEERENEELIVEGLEPSTSYQIAMYSEDQLRGWVNYTTLEPDIDPNAAGVIDIRNNESPSAVSDAVAAAPDGAIILVKRGVTYDFPNDNLNKSITIRAAYGFGEQKAKLFTTGNWDIDDGSDIDHIRFIDLELRGEDYGGDYVFNPNRENVHVGELSFDKCEIGTFRGILRVRTSTVVDNYIIKNSVVDSIGGYGLFTVDTEATAQIKNIRFENSTFNKIQWGVTSRSQSESFVIESCTFANFVRPGGGFFRYRGGDGNNNVTNGIVIHNSIFGHAWDESESGSYGYYPVYDGLENTNFDIVNVYSTNDYTPNSGYEIPGLPIGNYTGAQEDLWVDPANNDFNFSDRNFAGRFDTGDPRWRIVL
ncbi:DUF4957 domain-containing protein [Echinicola jeungdonensis]|uniref:DUF4957 domain-containing protein n=1 Tax=Echinicola jeungdonensis TaxID=709343 RepID=A0ABV5J3Z2_9BACT|nr:DUF4957 domain-containing protein [Echinicola jeungdonensis]MDN3670634.1 DUF4957 domain-containing protein [Echinicola jeungdonensis]